MESRMRVPWVLRERAMRAVVAMAAFAGVAIGLVIPFLTLTARERGVSLSVIGIMASSYLIAQMLLQFPLGALSDRIGRVPPIVVGMVIEAAGTAGFAVADRAETFILLRVTQGVGIALLYPAMRALVADVTPVDRRGQAYAAVGAAFSGGMLIAPPIGGLIAGWTGPSTLFVLGGALEVAVALSVLALLRGHGRPAAASAEGERAPLRALLARPLVGAFILAFAGQFQIGLFSGIWSIYLDDLGASDLQLGLSYSTFSIAFLLLAGLGGRLADRPNRARRLLLANLAMAGIILGYGLIPSVTAILILGLFEGTVATIFQPTLDAYLAGVADPGTQGRVQGAFSTIGMAGAALSALFSSVLYELGRPVPFLVGSAVLVALTVLAVGLIRQVERAGFPLRAAEPVTAMGALEDGPAPADAVE
ncbi:MAG: MFS transporter, partial [Thermomicrobiaceae bacterium]|nr:MFS transporter [Thermomicrobiaceae bacterium]